MKWLKALGIQFLGTAVFFSAVVSLGTSAILLIASCFGYLSYSDRPGPGWWTHAHRPSLAELGTYFGFAPWFAYFCLFFGIGLFGLALILSYTGSPKWLTRILGALIAACCAGLAVAGAGWYLALAAIGPDVAMGIGLLYGAFLFPRFVLRRQSRLPVWFRAVAISALVAFFGYWIVSQLLPRKPLPSLAIQMDRLTPSDRDYLLADTQFLGADVSKELSSLGLKGDLHGGISSSVGIGDEHQVGILLIALEPIAHEYKLAIPAHGYVVYVLKEGKWTPHPSLGEIDKRALLIEPGVDKQFEGGRIKIGTAKDFSSFTWYPAVALSSVR